MTDLPVLYAKDSKGRIKQWAVTSSDKGDVVTEYGLMSGKKMLEFYRAKPKNIGRSNETTEVTQATLEAQSLWNKKIKEGYTDSYTDFTESTLPPLAMNYQNAKKALQWPVGGLYKLDGVRCTMFHKDGVVTFQSRGGNDYPVIKEIADELIEKIFTLHPEAVVDGELYGHGMFLEDIVSAVKKPNEDTPRINFYVFDVLSEPLLLEGYCTRHRMVMHLLQAPIYSHCIQPPRRVVPVQMERLTTEAGMLAMHKGAIDKGFEGLVLRNLEGIFKFDYRSSDFQKYKIPCSAEFKVVGFEEDKRGGGTPICEYEGGDDESGYGVVGTFKATFAGNLEKKRELLVNKELYIGKYLTVDYEKLSKYGKPTKTVGKMFRELDEKGNPQE